MSVQSMILIYLREEEKTQVRYNYNLQLSTLNSCTNKMLDYGRADNFGILCSIYLDTTVLCLSNKYSYSLYIVIFTL